MADFYGMRNRRKTHFWHAVHSLFPFSHYVLLAAFFVLGLEAAFAFQRWLFLIAGVLLGLMLVGIVLVKIEEGELFHVSQAILPLLAAVGLSLFSVFLPTTPLTHLYFIGGGLIFFFALKYGARRAFPIWNWALSLVVYFLTVAAVFGFYFHLYVPILSVLIVIFLITFATAFQGLSRMEPALEVLLLPTLGVALGLTEVAWVLQFLPAHYLVGAGVLTTLYYIAFNLITISYDRALAYRDVLEYAGIGIVAALIIILTARWI
jgi:hypothetical protein